MLYEKEAATINEIQKGILAISCQEEPYDVFICYKETDENGERTHDSVDATDLYYELTEMGYKVFFSRITLEDKLGTAYEPYIFAALNSAKIMVVLGSKPEYFNAVWVKNEWSRFLSLMKTDRKRTLIPAYRNMDPYNLPKEFSHLQALDMNKLGFMSDLTRGIKKIIGDETIRDSKFKHLMNSAIPADGCKDITSSSNQSGTVTFYGFKKWLPVMSAVSIRINGIDIGTVSRGETLSWSFIGNANVDLRYCGDFNWRRNALSLTPGVTNVQLEYGVRTLVSKKW